jgi:hypothetical protein
MIGTRYYLGTFNSRAFSYPAPSLNFTEWMYVEYGYEPWDMPDNWILGELLKEYNEIYFFKPTNH